VEVYFPDFGWIEFEPTAGESLLSRPSGNDSTEPQDLNDPGPNSPLDEFDPFDNPQNDSLNLEQDNLLEDEPLFTGESNTLAEQPLWVWALFTPLLLIVGLLIIWRTKIFGPTAFSTDLPPIFYDHLQIWATRLGFPPRQHMTPYEQSSRLEHYFPEGKRYIHSITENYVQYQFNSQPIAADGVLGNTELMTGNSESVLPKAWKHLQPLFWKAWLHKIFSRIFFGP